MNEDVMLLFCKKKSVILPSNSAMEVFFLLRKSRLKLRYWREWKRGEVGKNGGFFICLKVPMEVLWSTIYKKLLNGIFPSRPHRFFGGIRFKNQQKIQKNLMFMAGLLSRRGSLRTPLVLRSMGGIFLDQIPETATGGVSR